MTIKLSGKKPTLRNEADNFIYSTEKAVKDAGDKVSEDEKSKIEAAISDLRGAHGKRRKLDDIKAKLETLKEASHKLAEILYQQQGQQGEAQGAPEGEASTEESQGEPSQNPRGQ
jgi:molecular chaperone DnaK